MRKALATTLATTLAIAVACGDDADLNVPVAPAPPSRHDDLRASIEADARAFSFQEGDWLEDLGDAPFFGAAWLARKVPLDEAETTRRDQALARARALIAGNLGAAQIEEQVMAVLALIERVGATHDQTDVPVIDSFVDRLDSLVHGYGDYLAGAEDQSPAIQTFGATAVTALVGLVFAQYALLVGGDRAAYRVDRAIALDNAIAAAAFGDLGYAPTNGSVRAFAIDPDGAALDLFPNVAMILLEGRLFRLTKNEAYRVEVRALYAALQPLKLSDTPARYASPYAGPILQAQTANVATLTSQNYLALALMVLFEITGEQRFIDEADRVLDAIETMRGPWCLSQVHTETCAPACGTGQACVVSACTGDACASGLLHHVVDGRLAQPSDPQFFCSGCNLQTLYVIGYRRSLAGEAW